MHTGEVSAIANVAIAFSTFIVGGGALAYYIKEITQKGTFAMLTGLIIYILLTAILLTLTKRNLK